MLAWRYQQRVTVGLATEMFTTLHDSRGEYDAPAKFRMPSTKSIVGALESVCASMLFESGGLASAFCVPVPSPVRIILNIGFLRCVL